MFRPSKALGQNFLTDINISEKIVRLSGINKSCGVLEIGPGFGSLTRFLAESAGHVTAVEKDSRLYGSLQETFIDCPNITLIHGDVLKQDINSLIRETLSGLTPYVCANLPYSITTPVITQIIESRIFASITVMIQKEVAKRIYAKPGNSDYGSFSVFVNYYCEPEILFDVPPECFTPRPKVISSVVRLSVRSERIFCNRTLTEQDEIELFRVVRASFGQRRKTLVNALCAVYKSSYSKEFITDVVRSCGFDVNIRGESLSIEDFIKLSDALKAKT